MATFGVRAVMLVAASLAPRRRPPAPRRRPRPRRRARPRWRRLRRRAAGRRARLPLDGPGDARRHQPGRRAAAADLGAAVGERLHGGCRAPAVRVTAVDRRDRRARRASAARRCRSTSRRRSRPAAGARSPWRSTSACPASSTASASAGAAWRSSPTRCPPSPTARAGRWRLDPTSRPARRGPTRRPTGACGSTRRPASRSRRPACSSPTGRGSCGARATTRGPRAACARSGARWAASR